VAARWARYPRRHKIGKTRGARRRVNRTHDGFRPSIVRLGVPPGWVRSQTQLAYPPHLFDEEDARVAGLARRGVVLEGDRRAVASSVWVASTLSARECASVGCLPCNARYGDGTRWPSRFGGSRRPRLRMIASALIAPGESMSSSSRAHEHQVVSVALVALW